MAFCTISCQSPADSPPQAATTEEQGLTVERQGPAAARQLLPGTPLEGVLRPGELHQYTLDLAAGEFVHLLVDQRGVDVGTTLFAPGGRSMIEVDRDIGYRGPEPLLAVVSAAGTYTVVVRAFEGNPPQGTYEVEIRELHKASPRDLLRAEAAALVSGRRSLQHALDLWQRVGDKFWLAETLLLLADVEKDPEEATSLYEQSAALFGMAGDLPTQGTALSRAGILRYRGGDVQEALAYLEQARTAYRAAGDRSGEASIYSNLGQVRRAQGRYEQALKLYSQALELWDEERDRCQRIQTLHNLGVLYRVLGKVELAADHLKEAESALSMVECGRLRAATLNQLGRLFQQRDAPLEALGYHQQALELRRQGKDLRGEANTLVDIGFAHQALGRVGEALAVYLESLTILRHLDPPRPRVLAKVLFALGSLYSTLGQDGEALGYLEESTELQREFEDPAGEAEGLFRMSFARANLGDLVAARAAAGEAVVLVERVRLSAVSPELRSSFFSTVQHLFERLIDLLMRLHDEQPNAGYAAQALKVSEQARARSLLEMLAEAGADIRSGVAPELLAGEKELQEKLNRSARRLQLLERDSWNRRGQIEEEKKLREIAADLDTVRSEIRRRSPRYAALTQPRPLGLLEIQRRLLDREAADKTEIETLLLKYHLGDERSFLWLISHDDLQVFELPGRASLEELARRAYEQVRLSNRPESYASSRQLLCRLSRTLLGPIADRLERKRLQRKRLVIVADGALQFLPFAALPDPQAALPLEAPGGCAAAPPMVVAHEIVYLPSASALAVLRQGTAAQAPVPGLVAVLADPVFSPKDARIRSHDRAPEPPILATTLGGFPRLEHSRTEAQAILSLVAPERRLSAFNFAANKDIVLSGGLAGYRIVHFATHAILDTSQPELSGLVLSQVDESGRQRDDAFLRVHELYNLDLPAELVVLSACNTALGQEVRGEGLVGLTRGFMYAGARRVVVSLWSVSDDSTSRLMTHFYEGLLAQGLAPAAALRQAQITLWQERPAPFHWAAFVLEGEWGPLPL